MILETIVTTLSPNGECNLSPMGPTVDDDLAEFELRPFDSSQTFKNLRRTKQGVLHITDDVLLFAKAVTRHQESIDSFESAESIEGKIIPTACRYYEFKVEFIDESGPRMLLKCRTTKAVRLRDFFGFNRAKHAVLEAAILATRLDFIPQEEIEEQFRRLESPVRKTGGPDELLAFEILCDFVRSSD